MDTYNPDAVICKESWLQEDIVNAEVFRAYFTTFRRARSARGGGVLSVLKISLPLRSYG